MHSVIFSVFEVQAWYRRVAASLRVKALVERQVRMMCHEVSGRLGHARWLKREIATVQAIRDRRD